RAKKKLLAKNGEYIPGVGINLTRFQNIVGNKEKLIKNIGVPLDAFIILSIGELNKNKNHKVIIQSISKLENQKIHYIICGSGPLKDELQNISKELEIKKNVHLIGHRDDIPEICKISDVFAFP